MFTEIFYFFGSFFLIFQLTNGRRNGNVREKIIRLMVETK